MRAKRAKAMRRADPDRPNPGRKHGGAKKHEVKSSKLRSLRPQRKFFMKSGISHSGDGSKSGGD